MEQLVNGLGRRRRARRGRPLVATGRCGRSRAVIDVYTHEADIRGALWAGPADPSEPFGEWALPACTEPFFAGSCRDGRHATADHDRRW